MKNIFKAKTVYFLILFLRVVFPLFIYQQPLSTVLAVTFLDAVDGEFAAWGVLSRKKYTEIDKILDSWWYLWALAFSYFNLRPDFILLLGLFLYRIVGIIILFKIKNRKILAVFPNFFENAFFLFFLATYFHWSFIVSGKVLYFSLLFVFLLKILQEYWLHIAQKSIMEDVLKLYKHRWLPD